MDKSDSRGVDPALSIIPFPKHRKGVVTHEDLKIDPAHETLIQKRMRGLIGNREDSAAMQLWKRKLRELDKKNH